MGAKLTVRKSQAAVFMNEGKIADVLVPCTLFRPEYADSSTLKG